MFTLRRRLKMKIDQQWKWKSKCYRYYYKAKIIHVYLSINYPAGVYLIKVNNGGTWTMCKTCSKLTIKTQKNNAVMVSLLLTLSRFHTLLWCLNWWISTDKYRLWSQPVLTFSKLTIETLEQDVKYVQS